MGIPLRHLAFVVLTIVALAVAAQTDPPAGQPYDDVRVLYAQAFLADPGPARATPRPPTRPGWTRWRAAAP